MCVCVRLCVSFRDCDVFVYACVRLCVCVMCLSKCV